MLGGLVGLADTQVVKGAEVSSKSKLSLHRHGGHRFFVMTSGLRSVRDKVVLRLEDSLDGLGTPMARLHQVSLAFGDELRNVRAEDGPSLEQSGLRFNLHAIIGGQLVNDDQPVLVLIYPAGNWVIATRIRRRSSSGGARTASRSSTVCSRRRRRWSTRSCWRTWPSTPLGHRSSTWTSRLTSSSSRTTANCANAGSRRRTWPPLTTVGSSTSRMPCRRCRWDGRPGCPGARGSGVTQIQVHCELHFDVRAPSDSHSL